MEKTITKRRFKYKYAYKLASYDKNLPFDCDNDEISNISYNLIKTIYERN